MGYWPLNLIAGASSTCPVDGMQGAHIEFLDHGYGRYVCENGHKWYAPDPEERSQGSVKR